MRLEPWVEDYVGLPWEEHGRDRSGIDCWGLYRLVMREQFGVALPSYRARYRSTSNRAELNEAIADELEQWVCVAHRDRVPSREIAARRYAPGHGILMLIDGERSHIGIVCGPYTMLHIQEGRTARPQRYDGIAWRDRIEGVYRHVDQRF